MYLLKGFHNWGHAKFDTVAKLKSCKAWCNIFKGNKNWKAEYCKGGWRISHSCTKKRKRKKRNQSRLCQYKSVHVVYNSLQKARVGWESRLILCLCSCISCGIPNIWLRCRSVHTILTKNMMINNLFASLRLIMHECESRRR